MKPGLVCNKHKLVEVVSIIMMIAALSLSLFVMISASKRLTEKTEDVLSEFYLKEIADRATSSVNTLIDKKIERLEQGLGEKLLTENYYTVEEVTRYLNSMVNIENLRSIVLIGQSGKVFRSNGEYAPYESENILQSVTERQTRFVKTEDCNLLIISFPISNLQVEGEEIISCSAQIQMETLIDSRMLTPASEGSNTYTRLFNIDGYNMLNMDSGSMDNSNLFERYEQTATFEDGFSIEKIRNDWQNGESGYSVYSADHGKSHIYYEPVEGTNLMVMCLSRSTKITEAVSDSNDELTRISVIQTVFVIIVFVVFTILIIRRISERRKQQEQAEQEKIIQEALERAEAANNAKTAFLFNMSHDIRTPMNAIMGFRDLLEKHQEDPERRADYLKKIEDSSQVLLSIINNVLEMARIEKGTLELDESAWSAEQFIDTLYSIFNEMMAEKGITFTKKVVVQHPYVYCDTIKLREVFFNILSNAYKYTNEGGSVSIELEEIPCEREGYAFYQVTVTDTGIGMSEEFIPHIFEEFSRENTTTDNKIEGTGLGMPIVKRLVDFMGGTIEVKSEKGVGSSFIVKTPHRIAEKSNLVECAGVEIDPTLFQGKRILLAEDNALNAEIAVEILNEAGFIVDVAEDGVICYEMLATSADHYYNLILMDIQMPNMNGYDTTRAIRQMPDLAKANIPILAMTANAFEEDKREAYRSGMNGHLAKPIDVKELMKTLAGIIG